MRSEGRRVSWLFPSEPAHAGVSELVEVEGTEGIEKSYSIDDMMIDSKGNVTAAQGAMNALSFRRNSATSGGGGWADAD